MASLIKFFIIFGQKQKYSHGFINKILNHFWPKTKIDKYSFRLEERLNDFENESNINLYS